MLLQHMPVGSTSRASKHCFATAVGTRTRPIARRMATRNYFSALLGLSLEDSPVSSPSAAAAAVRWVPLMMMHVMERQGQLTLMAQLCARSLFGTTTTSARHVSSNCLQVQLTLHVCPCVMCRSSGSTAGRGNSSTIPGAAASTAGSTNTSGRTSAEDLKPKPNRPKLSEPLVWIDLEMTGRADSCLNSLAAEGTRHSSAAALGR